MSYNTAIPQSSTPRSQSQRQIKANFQAIQQVFANNHASLSSDSEFYGMHNVLTMKTTTDPVTSADQIGLYTKVVGSVVQLFFKPNDIQNPIQLTYDSINTNPANKQQYSFIAGPFVIYIGELTGITNNQVITLSPTKTLIYVGVNQSSPSYSTADNYPINVTNIAGSAFTVTQSGYTKPFNIYYFAVGV